METARIPVGVEVEHLSAAKDGQNWKIVAVRPGVRRLAEWTVLAETDGVTRFYAGTAQLTLRAADAPLHSVCLSIPEPLLHVVLRCGEGPHAWKLHAVTLMPPEDTAGTLSATLPMPPALRTWVSEFVSRHAKPSSLPPPPPNEPPKEPEAFLDRWSRLKQRDPRQPEPSLPAAAPSPSLPPDLSPLDGLRSRDDYAAFLRSGAPAVLRLAALRQAWAGDPAITGHKPLVDYDWNFNAPGYGRLLPTDDASKLVRSLFKHLRQEAEPGEPQTDLAAAPEASESLPPEPEATDEASSPPAPPKRHGGAAPA